MVKFLMPLVCPIEELSSRQMVICDSRTAMDAHKGIFHFNDKAYQIAPDKETAFDYLSSILSALDADLNPSFSNIHLTLCWENMIRVSQWHSAKPSIGEALTLMRIAGLHSNDLQPFRTADINDIFPSLYYSKRFDI
ncbi:MAG: hypothetical protein L0Y62_01985, partial [Nitrospirae bacterium]|nr:hypothetical protein [Nitrospirota bacterium]